jgi:hypothetical protein
VLLKEKVVALPFQVNCVFWVGLCPGLKIKEGIPFCCGAFRAVWYWPPMYWVKLWMMVGWLLRKANSIAITTQPMIDIPFIILFLKYKAFS